MSEQNDLLTEWDAAPQVVYIPKVISALMVSWSSNAFGRTSHHAVDLNRYLSSIWCTHAYGYRYINIKDVRVEQRINETDIMSCTITLDMVYRDGEFTVNHAAVDNVGFERANTHPLDCEYVTYDNVTDPVIESITVDKTHVVVTGHKAPEPKVKQLQVPSVLSHVILRDVAVNGKSNIFTFNVSLRHGTLRHASDGKHVVELDNVRLWTFLDSDVTDITKPIRKLEIGITAVIAYVNHAPVVTDVKVISPCTLELKGGKWVRVEGRNDWFGYATALMFDASNDYIVNIDMPENFELHPFVYDEGMNHHPAYPGIWVRYNNWRLKDRYDIQLHDGSRWDYYFTNGGSFSKWPNGDSAPRFSQSDDAPQRVEDADIAMIRLVPDDEVFEKYHFKGEERLKRNIEMFGDALPEVIELPNGEVRFKIRHRRVFQHKQIIADVPESDIFNHTSTVAGPDDHTLTEVLHVPFTVDTPLFKSAVRHLKGVLEDKQYSGLALMEHDKHGYVGCLNGENFADRDIAWVVRTLIDVAKTLPKRPVEKNVGTIAHLHHNNINELVETIRRNGVVPNQNGRVYPVNGSVPKKPVNNKAAKKAAKKERTRQRKEVSK